MSVEPDLPFFRNPTYANDYRSKLRTHLEPGLLPFLDDLHEGLDTKHFLERAAGVGRLAEHADGLVGCFSGRERELRRLSPWMNGVGDETLAVVTGSPRVGNPQIAMGPRSARARQAADWLTRHAGIAARAFALAFCREVHTYLSKPDSYRRCSARSAVASAIARHRPEVVIAHSLGSVVAYETLWEYPLLEIELFVTIGSPLAMPGVVLPRLQPEIIANRGARPPGVAKWVNLADVGDIVAIPREGLGPHFDGVEYDGDVVIGEWDFHTVRNYLVCPDVRQLIAG